MGLSGAAYLIESCVVSYWALFLSLAVFLLMGVKLNWKFFQPTPASEWITRDDANPASDLIPLIDPLIAPQEGCKLKVVSYAFSEDAHWHDDDTWNNRLRDWSKNGVEMQLIGGHPHKPRSKEFLEELAKCGNVEVRFLKTPPTRHSVIVSCNDKSFIWIEERHKDDDTAHGIFYKNSPNPDELEKAHRMFNALWDTGAKQSTAM